MIDKLIKGEMEIPADSNIIINEEVGFDATTITEADVEAYGLGA